MIGMFEMASWEWLWKGENNEERRKVWIEQRPHIYTEIFKAIEVMNRIRTLLERVLVLLVFGRTGRKVTRDNLRVSWYMTHVAEGYALHWTHRVTDSVGS
jgi:hypothetical protein